MYAYAVRYALARLRAERFATVRSVGYLAAIIAAMACFTMLMPALRYQHVAAIEHAEHDVWVSGPADRVHLEALDAEPDVRVVSAVMMVGADRVTHGQDVLRGSTLILYERADTLGAGPCPSELLLEGRPPADGQLACDWTVARRLGVRPGDELRVTLALPEGPMEVSGILSGVYGPSAHLRDAVIAPLDRESRTLLRAAGVTERYTDTYVVSPRPGAVGTALSTLADDAGASELMAVPRAELESSARGTLAREIGPFLRGPASVVAVLGLLAVSQWQHASRLAQRRREHALLAALGVPRRFVHLASAIEHTAVLGAAAALGMIAARIVMEELTLTFVPPRVLAMTAGLIAVSALLALGSGAISMQRRFGRDASWVR